MSNHDVLRYHNQDLVQMKEINQSSLVGVENFQKYICDNLVKETAPYDLSNTGVLNLSIEDSSMNGNTIINNSESLITNELFALKMNYVDVTPIVWDSYDVNIGNGNDIPTRLEVFNDSVSLYDSNLKIDVSYNNDKQYTTDEDWSVQYDRSVSLMNTFSCINAKSQYVDPSNAEPFILKESLVNQYALGVSDKWVARNGVNTGDLTVYDISSENRLGTNNLDLLSLSDPAEVDFTKYKLQQDIPTVDASLNHFSSGNVLPIQYNDSDISTSSFNHSGVFDASNRDIGSGFSIKLTVGGVVDGGYSVVDNSFVTFDNSNLYRGSDNYVRYFDVSNVPHNLDVTNGTLVVVGDNDTDLIDIDSTGYETLDASNLEVDKRDGTIKIRVSDIFSRMIYLNNSGNVRDPNDKSGLTEKVEVIYDSNDREEDYHISDLNGSMRVTENVSFYVETIVPSTKSADFPASDKRNLAFDNSAALVIVSPNTNLSTNINSSDFSLNYVPNNNNIEIISITNQSILSEETPVKDVDGNDIDGVCSVVIQNVDLSDLSYTDYRIVLNTKKINEIGLAPTNSWTVENSGNYLIGSATKTSIIYDDYLFMTREPEATIPITYTFKLATDGVTNVNAIKHQIKIDFSDNETATCESYGSGDSATVYLDDNDITYFNKSVSDVSSANLTGVSGINGYNVNEYTFKEITRTSTFQAKFDSKFPLYTNVVLETPPITETITFYKIFKVIGNRVVEQPSYLLRNFTYSGHHMCDVSVSDASVSTKVVLTQSMCSIFKASIWGRPLNGAFEQLPNVSNVDLDPFFRNISEISGIDGNDGKAIINVNVNNTEINKTSYYIDTVTAPGVEYSIVAKRFVYDLESNGTVFDENFDAYMNYSAGNGLLETSLTTEVVRENGTITVKISDNTGIIATVHHPTNYINNYNIVKCLVPLFNVRTINTQTSYQRMISSSKVLKLADGVYYTHTNSPARGDNEYFKLDADRFNLSFCGANYPNNNENYYTDDNTYFKFTQAIIQDYLRCAGTGSNQTRGIKFGQIRGWYRGAGGINTITLQRTPMSVSFKFNGNNNEYSQTFDNFAYGSSYIVDRVSYEDVSYNLGLVLNGTASMLPTDFSTPDVTVSVANYTTNIITNPYKPSIVGTKSNANLGSTGSFKNQLFYGYISGLAPVCIKSYGSHTVTVTYTVPDLKVYKIVGGSVSESLYNTVISDATSLYAFIQSTALGVPAFAQIFSTRDMSNQLLTLQNYGNSLQNAINNSLNTIEIVQNIKTLYETISRDNYFDATNTNLAYNAWPNQWDTRYANVVALSDALTTASTPWLGNPALVSSWGTVSETKEFNTQLNTGFTLAGLKITRDTNYNLLYNAFTAYKVVARPVMNVFGLKYNAIITSVPILNEEIGSKREYFGSFDITDAVSYSFSSVKIPDGVSINIYNENELDYRSYVNSNQDKHIFELKGNKIKIAYFMGGVGDYDSNNSPVLIDATPNATPIVNIFNGVYDALVNLNTYDVSLNSANKYNISFSQPAIGTNNTLPGSNIHFSLGSAFTPPNTKVGSNGNPIYYLRFKPLKGTRVSIYQSNIVFNGENRTLVVDRYDTDTTVDYNKIINSTTKEIYFPVYSHYTSSYSLTYKDGNKYQDYVNDASGLNLSYNFTQDLTFAPGQYVGITFNSIKRDSYESFMDLLSYRPLDFAKSKALYVRIQDVMKIYNILGTSIFRITNSGVVITPKVTTAGISLYVSNDPTGIIGSA